MNVRGESSESEVKVENLKGKMSEYEVIVVNVR